jgi:hypothetical protein
MSAIEGCPLKRGFEITLIKNKGNLPLTYDNCTMPAK